MKLFKIYANNVKKDHTNLLLNSSLGISYNIDTIEEILKMEVK